MTGRDGPPLPPLTPRNQWTCRVCHRQWVVPDLARACEAKDLAMLP